MDPRGWRGSAPRDVSRLFLGDLPMEWAGIKAALPCFHLREVQHYGISRDDVTLGRILGEGFFGEVYEGIYTTPVRFPPFPCPPPSLSSQIRDPGGIWDDAFPLFFLGAERGADQRGREDLQEGLQPGKQG